MAEKPPDLDQDPERIGNPQDVIRLIRLLKEEKKQKEEFQKGLERKLLKLDAALAEKREDVENLQRTLQLEKSKATDEDESRRKEREGKAKTQEERIRSYLTEVLYMKPQSDDKSGFEIETVQVSYVPQGKTLRYNLAFRINSDTRTTHLLEAACKYWGVDREYFILRTMANNKCADEITVKDCFKQGEIAHLRLEPKKKTSSQPPLEEELKAIQPKKVGGGKRKGVQGGDGAIAIARHDAGFSTAQLKKLGGANFLLKIQEGKPSEHLAKLNVRDMIIFLVVMILTFNVYTSRRPDGAMYWFLHGARDPVLTTQPYFPPDFASSRIGPKVPAFKEVRTLQDVQDWLNFTIPQIFWNTSQRLSIKTFNMLPGYVALRVKNVQNTPNVTCVDSAKTVASVNASCYSRSVSPASELTAPYPALATYWGNVTQNVNAEPLSVLRGPANPAVWLSPADNLALHGVVDIVGDVQNYDAGGYVAEYRMAVQANLSTHVANYRQDLQQFFSMGLINPLSTRAVILSFTVYNPSFDNWAAVDLLFETSASGAVNPQFSVVGAKPRMGETATELSHTYMDYIRILLAIYILIVVGMMERRHKTRYNKAGYLYHISLTGISDQGIVACIFTVCIWTWSTFNSLSTAYWLNRANDPTRGAGFYSFSYVGWQQQTIFCVEGLLMVLAMFRIITLTRLSGKVYTLWNAMGKALAWYGYIVLTFLPALIAFVFLARSQFGSVTKQFSTLSYCGLEAYKLLNNQVDASRIQTSGAAFTLVMVIIFYIVISFLLQNALLAILINAYYRVKITTVQNSPEDWGRAKWLQWACPVGIGAMIEAFLDKASN